ncbi:hypothetical protein A2U01_0096022, partial [Trifolium medium]|nr:hypothetical protein [Trifolium medium]
MEGGAEADLAVGKQALEGAGGLDFGVRRE